MRLRNHYCVGGFILVEKLVVLILIFTLSAIAVPSYFHIVGMARSLNAYAKITSHQSNDSIIRQPIVSGIARNISDSSALFLYERVPVFDDIELPTGPYWLDTITLLEDNIWVANDVYIGRPGPVDQTRLYELGVVIVSEKEAQSLIIEGKNRLNQLPGRVLEKGIYVRRM